MRITLISRQAAASTIASAVTGFSARSTNTNSGSIPQATQTNPAINSDQMVLTQVSPTGCSVSRCTSLACGSLYADVGQIPGGGVQAQPIRGGLKICPSCRLLLPGVSWP